MSKPINQRFSMAGIMATLAAMNGDMAFGFKPPKSSMTYKPNGARERRRRLEQIASGYLREENGLWRTP